MFDIFENKSITGIYSVRVVEESDYFDLTDTLVIELDGDISIQVLNEDGFTKLSLIHSNSNIEIFGEYVPIELKLLPLRVSFSFPFQIINTVTFCTIDPLIKGRWQDTENKTGNNYILGCHMKGVNNNFFIRLAYEEVVIESVKDAKTFFHSCNLDYKTCLLKNES